MTLWTISVVRSDYPICNLFIRSPERKTMRKATRKRGKQSMMPACSEVVISPSISFARFFLNLKGNISLGAK